jgi:hypothetical protein
MSELKLALRENRTAFAPGDAMSGAAGWKLDRAPQSAEIRLFWRTEGKGSQDVTVVETIKFEAPSQEEARPFEFTAPESPYSFSGQLISLIWSLELVLKPGKESTRLDLVISPSRREILLEKTDDAGA